MGLVENVVYGIQKKKAHLIISKGEGTRFIKLEAQFNPSEYRIHRGLSLSRVKALGSNPTPADTRAAADNAATLSVKLHFDTASELFSLFSSKPSLQGLKTVAAYGLYNTKKFIPKDVTQALVDLVMFDADAHAPNNVRLVWGTLDFVGKVESCAVSNTMFAPDGTVLRVSVDLTIRGEEQRVINKKRSPFNSPDRTKERTLGMMDELWMHAEAEYSDPEMWRPIAKANNILNPRRISLSKISIPPI